MLPSGQIVTYKSRRFRIVRRVVATWDNAHRYLIQSVDGQLIRFSAAKLPKVVAVAVLDAL
jgi:hypothetical protein